MTANSPQEHLTSEETTGEVADEIDYVQPKDTVTKKFSDKIYQNPNRDKILSNIIKSFGHKHNSTTIQRQNKNLTSGQPPTNIERKDVLNRDERNSSRSNSYSR